ncbi:MAG: sigma-54-dependent Fis family transcriptional regulator [Deferribacteres bacterium]|nr:sigma-54-dependent Fis family transcriptional regulator [Deferribacteres bacterium]
MNSGHPDATILIVEDSEITRRALTHILRRGGFECLEAEDGFEALGLIERHEVDIVLSDQQMPGMDGIELLGKIKSRYPDIPFILLTAHGSVTKAVISIKQGADDYLEKPCEPENLVATIRRSLSFRQLSETNKKLKEHLRSRYCFQNMVTRSSAMMRALELAEKVARTPDTTVAIYGESGTGKEVLARAIHFAGRRMENRFVAVNCAGIPSSLFESELFGHVRGAFTGADRDRDGKFELARGGTILLDEIGDMPVDLQAKLLRVLEERCFERVGSNKPVKADFRLIVATNRDIAELVREGKFRKDLYHRINTFPITLPPLRERKEDIPLLVEHFMEQFRKDLGKKLRGVSQKAMDVLMSYNWPGNIRELRNCLERAAILIEDELVRPEHLIIRNGGPLEEDGMVSITLPANEFTLDTVIDRALETALRLCNNNKSRAAELLNVGRKMFYRRKDKS